MKLNMQSYILIFMFYSISGWFIEVFLKRITHKKIINRGFLVGPYLPIYGYGILLITFFLNKYKNDIIILFCMSFIMCSILEYITSYLMEKIFCARWWDYSKKPFNVNGRICLINSIAFGIGGIFVINFMNPFLLEIITKIPNIVLIYIIIIFLIIYFIDNIISFSVIAQFRNVTKTILEDNTEVIRNKVNKYIQDFLKIFQIHTIPSNNKIKIKIKKIYAEKGILHRRLVLAFPNFEAKLKKIKRKNKKIEKK